jgi:hypothetical protein
MNPSTDTVLYMTTLPMGSLLCSGSAHCGVSGVASLVGEVVVAEDHRLFSLETRRQPLRGMEPSWSRAAATGSNRQQAAALLHRRALDFLETLVER